MHNDNCRTTTWNSNSNNNRGPSDPKSISNMSSPTLNNLCRFLSVVVVIVSCCSSAIVHPQLQMNNNKITNNSNIQIDLHKLDNGTLVTFEFLQWHIKIGTKTVSTLTVYRLPYSAIPTQVSSGGIWRLPRTQVKYYWHGSWGLHLSCGGCKG